MTERPPMIRGKQFSPPMVRALMRGDKTQTRRIASKFALAESGRAGDKIYVREHWLTVDRHDKLKPIDLVPGSPVQYYADRAVRGIAAGFTPAWGKFRQAMHMPRWCSRMTLEIAEVRVERLQLITEDDARAEGVVRRGDDLWSATDEGHQIFYPTAREAYAALWDSLGDEERLTWDANPSVIVTRFAVIHGNVDDARG